MSAGTIAAFEDLERAGDHEWNAAIWMLAYPSIRARTLVHADKDRRHIDWDQIKTHRGWSHGERILIDAAFSFWTGGSKSLFGRAGTPTEATIAEIFTTLSDGVLDYLLEGLRIRRNAR